MHDVVHRYLLCSLKKRTKTRRREQQSFFEFTQNFYILKEKWDSTSVDIPFTKNHRKK